MSGPTDSGSRQAFPDHPAARVTVHRQAASSAERGELVATVASWFEGARVSSWSVQHPTGHVLVPATSWRTAMSAIGPALIGSRGAR